MNIKQKELCKILNCACKDCKCRKVGCHVICKKYKEFKEQMQEINLAKEREIQDKSYIVDEYIRYYKRNKNQLHTCKY
jgi:hypothetical protein